MAGGAGIQQSRQVEKESRDSRVRIEWVAEKETRVEGLKRIVSPELSSWRSG